MHNHPPFAAAKGRVEGCCQCVADAMDHHLLFAIQKGGDVYMEGAQRNLGGELTVAVADAELERIVAAFSGKGEANDKAGGEARK